MKHAEIIKKINKRNCYTMKSISAMVGIKQNRLAEIISGQEPTKTEKHMIEVLEKFVKMASRGIDYSLEIKYQEEVLENLDNKIEETVKRLDPSTAEELKLIVECEKIESMYLGYFMTCDGKDEVIEKKVREIRK